MFSCCNCWWWSDTKFGKLTGLHTSWAQKNLKENYWFFCVASQSEPDSNTQVGAVVFAQPLPNSLLFQEASRDLWISNSEWEHLDPTNYCLLMKKGAYRKKYVRCSISNSLIWPISYGYYTCLEKLLFLIWNPVLHCGGITNADTTPENEGSTQLELEKTIYFMSD